MKMQGPPQYVSHTQRQVSSEPQQSAEVYSQRCLVIGLSS